MKQLFLNSAFLLFSFFSTALHAESFPHSREIVENSPEYQKIQKQLENIFLTKNSLNKPLCQILGNAENLNFSVGLNRQSAEKFFEQCGLQNQYVARSKIFKKRYFIFSSTHALLKNYSSWTTKDNITFLNEQAFSSDEDLTQSLLHEIAIAFDAKAGFYLSMAISKQPELFTQLTTENKNQLYQAFKYQHYLPINYVFSSLRAFSVESASFHQKIVSDHNFCNLAFIHLFNTFGFNREFLESENGIMDHISNSSSKKFSMEQIEDIVSLVLSPQLFVNSKMTFCQYMADPLLTGKSTFSFNSSGPRPNLGGGWTTSGKSISETMGKLESNTEILKPKTDKKLFLNLQGKLVNEDNFKIVPNENNEFIKLLNNKKGSVFND